MNREFSHHKNVNIEFEVNDSDKFVKPIIFSSKKYRTLHIRYKNNHLSKQDCSPELWYMWMQKGGRKSNKERVSRGPFSS